MVKKQKKVEKKPASKTSSVATKSKKKTAAVQEEANPLGKKFSCYSCSVKFYDLNKPEKICPRCGADQNSRPAQKIRSSKLSSKYNDYDISDEETAPEEEVLFDPEAEEESADIGLEEAIIDEE